jgi:hypothetical protein
MDAGERKCLEDIERYGCHVIHVLAEAELPPFAYSVGITRETGAAEVIVIGLKKPLAHSVVNEYNRRVRTGEKFLAGNCYAGFIEGFECQLRKVHASQYRDYLGWCRWLYNGNDFETLQIVYPNTSGIWPWESGASDWFRSWQPLLDQAASDGVR